MDRRQSLEKSEAAEADSKLAKLARGRRHTKESVVPGTDINFVWRVLTGEEKQACLGNACKRFKDLGIPDSLRSYNDLEDEMTWQVLSMAMRDPDKEGSELNPYPRPLATVDTCRRKLTIDERDILFSEYGDLEDEVDPDPMLAPEMWFDQIEAALKKKPAEASHQLSSFGSRTLIGYLLTMANPPENSPSGNSGSPLVSGGTSSEQSNPVQNPTGEANPPSE